MPTVTISPPRPDVSPFAILRAFLGVGLVSVGGGGTAHIRAAVVERHHWLSEDDFIEAMTVARTLPGTNVSNLAAFVGAMLAGWRGAVCAAAGVVVPGAVIVIGAAVAYLRVDALHTPVAQGLLHGLTAGAVGVMAALVWQTARSSLRGYGAIAVAVAALAAVAIMRVNMAYVLVALVPLSAALNRKK